MKFNIDDKVKVVNDYDIWLKSYDLPSDTVLTIVEDDEDSDDYINNEKKTIEITAVEIYQNDFEKVADSYFSGGLVNTANFGLMGEAGSERIIPLTRDKTDLGVYRPVLEDRKVGKVRVELVDDGFPLALREIAKVMTWAQTAKGYKDHDWQNLPNAEVSLAGAASRHRTDHIMQRVFEGLNIDQCVDHESKLLHKAHEAFGVLAQLELMLRGKFE